MKKNDISEQYARIMTTQEYQKRTPILGVRFIPLTYNKDDGGEFVELARVSSGKLLGVDGFQIAQCSMSLLLSGTVKAFHLHFHQSDAWFVSPHERMLVGLLDTRKSSPTKDETMRFVLGAGVAQLLIIPAGVAHGAANPWDKPVTMTYFTNQQFSPSSPDEQRLPYDLFGKAFWEPSKG